MIGEMVGKKDMRRPGKVRVKRDPMQPAIAAKIGAHPPYPVGGASDGVHPPQVATAASHPGASVRSERQIHWFANEVRPRNDLNREASRYMNLRTSSGRERQDNAGKSDSDGNRAITMQHGMPKDL